MKNLFSQSENISHEYCCTIVKLGAILPIEGAHTVAMTEVNGRTIVIGKEHQEGDIMFYCSNQSQLNQDFLSINNLYQDIELNANADEVIKWIDAHSDASEEEITAYKRAHRGYFNSKSQVRMTKLAGVSSMGFLFSIDEMAKWCPIAADVDLEPLIDTDFDTVNGELFIHAYVPPVKEHAPGKGSAYDCHNKNFRKYNRMIPGQFTFHYDTQLLERCFNKLKPEDVVNISVKLHGTSFIMGNVLVKTPFFSGWYERNFKKLPRFLQFTKKKYDVVYSSRNQIKNSDINTRRTSKTCYEVEEGVGLDRCFNKYYELLRDYIPEGITIYGEIIGYVEGTNSFVQKIVNGYDYGCKPGSNQLMIYRVTELSKTTGRRKEYDIPEVVDFVHTLQKSLPDEVATRLRVIDTVYHGALKDLYPEISITDEDWGHQVLERMKVDKNFGMEANEPFCRLKVPREGIVLRIDGDAFPEAFKLKCLKFLGKEAEEIDKGTLEDAEMQERY